MDFATKTIEFRENSIKLQIWDSAGQERYKALIPSYVRGASIILIVYDISSRETFYNLSSWITFIKEVNTDDSLLVLCGNKTDLNRQVSTKEGKALADKEKMLFFETSAKNSSNINLMMFTCISELPFFTAYEMDKLTLIKELSSVNSKGEQNSIYDIVNTQGQAQNNELNVNSGANNSANEQQKKLEEEKKKCGC